MTRKICKVEECNSFVEGLGLCKNHRRRYKKYGTTDLPVGMTQRRHPETVKIRDKQGRKHCIGCDEWLEEALYGRDASKSDNLSTKCRLCRRFQDMLSRYSLSKDRFIEFLKKQNYTCGICPSTGLDFRGWHIDHDHSCCPAGKSCGRCIRGLLCFTCNILLGVAKDNTEILNNAVRYLETSTNTRDKLSS